MNESLLIHRYLADDAFGYKKLMMHSSTFVIRIQVAQCTLHTRWIAHVYTVKAIIDMSNVIFLVVAFQHDK